MPACYSSAAGMAVFGAVVDEKIPTIPDDLKPLSTMPWNERPDALPLEVEECRTAIWRSGGNITEAASLLRISPTRLRTFVRNSPYLSAEVKEVQERLLDISEEVVYEALTDTEDAARRDTMARFALTNLGGERGYGQKGGVNLKLPNKGVVSISWDDGSTITGPAPGSGPHTIEHEAAE